MDDKVIRILLIADSPADARFVREALADTPLTGITVPAFDITCARRLSSALRRLAKSTFDAILLNLALADSRGLDTFDRVQAQAPQTPILILSDVADRDLAIEAMQRGAQDYLFKGEVSGSLLVRAIRYAIERNRLETALQRSEALLNESQGIALVGSWELDVVANRLVWSDEVYRMFGLRPQDFGATYEAFLETVHPDDRAAVDAAYTGSLREGRDTYEIEHRIIRRDNGEVRVVHEKCRHVKDRSGRIVRSIGMVQDITERKWAEEALNRERDLVRRIMETSPAGIVMVNREGQITFANTRAEQVLGLTRAEIRSRTYNDPLWRITDYDGNPFLDEELPFRRVMATGQPVFGVRHAIEWPDGRRVLLAINGAPLLDAAGRVDGMVASVEDVTAQVRAEAALRESEARYRAMIESQVDLISRYLPDTTLTFVNDAYCKFFGKTREELIGQSFLFMIAPEFRELVRRETEELAKAPRPLAGEYLNYRYDGKECWIQWVVQCICDEEGRVVELQAVGRDITERKRAEEALRESEEKYRDLVERANDGIVIVQDAIVQYANPYLVALWGGSVEEVIGTRFSDYVAPDELPKVAEHYTRRMAGESAPPVYETVLLRKNGERVHVEMNAGVIKYQGKPADLVIIRDITERRQAEEALRKSERFLQDVFDAIRDGISVLDADLNVIRTNRWMEEMYAHQAPLVGRKCYQVYQQRRSPCPWCPSLRTIETGEPHTEVVPYPSADNPTGWIELSAFPIKDEQGRVTTVIEYVKDITRRVQAEEALRRESAFRHTVIRRATEGLCVCHDIPEYPYVAFTVWNDRMTEITGYTMEEINRLGWYQTMYPDPEVQQRAVERMARMRQGDDIIAEEWTVTRADGAQRTLLISTSVLETDEAGTHVLAVMQDVTERKQAEEERERLLTQVQEQARQVQEIMDTVPEGVLLLDSNHRILLANPLGKRDLETLADAQVGDTLTHLGDRSIEELLTSPPAGLWHEVATASRFFQVLARPIENGPVPRGWVLVIRDVTQQREAEQRAQQQERLAAVGQLAAGIAHDFNNIMAVIALYAGMSAQTPGLPAKMYERLQTIQEQAQRATALIQQILDFSRRAVLERRPMDLLPFMKEQAKLLERTLPESIKVELVYGKDDYTVDGDPTRLQQAMMNLAANARDAMPEGGRLRITLERIQVQDPKQAPLPGLSAGDWIAVGVSDTGIGIAPDVLPHIFEPFFTTKAVGEGTGLGLAQVYGIVKQHEGYIDVKTQVGQGTTLTLYLPALTVPLSRPSAIEMAQFPRGHGETVLVVEDNAAARRAVVSSLEMLGYRTLEASNGEDALTLYSQHGRAIALVLSDVVMPEMGGRALLRALKERDPAVRVVLLTGHPFEEQEFENLRAEGLRGWVLKPLSLEQLAHVVARALE